MISSYTIDFYCMKMQMGTLFRNHYDGNALSFNPGLQYPHLHGPVHTPDNNRWDTPPV